MKRSVGPLVWMAGGVALGVVIALLTGVVAMPFGLGRSTVIMERMPTNLLGRALLGPASPHFVADSRSRHDMIGGIHFYPEATSTGETLCRVQVHHVSGYFFQGKPVGSTGIEVWESYGVRGNGSDCGAFRDFGNVFQYVGPGEPEDAIAVLAQAKEDGVRGRASVALTCQRQSGSRCDARHALQAVDVRHIAWIEVLRHEELGGTTWATYRYFVHHDGDRRKPPYADVVIRSQKTHDQIPVLIQGTRIHEVQIRWP